MKKEMCLLLVASVLTLTQCCEASMLSKAIKKIQKPSAKITQNKNDCIQNSLYDQYPILKAELNRKYVGEQYFESPDIVTDEQTFLSEVTMVCSSTANVAQAQEFDKKYRGKLIRISLGIDNVHWYRCDKSKGEVCGEFNHTISGFLPIYAIFGDNDKYPLAYYQYKQNFVVQGRFEGISHYITQKSKSLMQDAKPYLDVNGVELVFTGAKVLWKDRYDDSKPIDPRYSQSFAAGDPNYAQKIAECPTIKAYL